MIHHLLSEGSPLTFREFMMNESLPLGEIQRIILRFLQQRTDAVLFGAQAVNAYVDAPRMTEDVDIMAIDAEALSRELCQHLHQSLNIAVRVRNVASGKGFRVYQLRTPTNRHLVDIRQVDAFPAHQLIEDIRVVRPAELLALKVISMAARPHTPKGQTDKADILRLLIAFPEYKSVHGAVADALNRLSATTIALQIWNELVAREIQPDVNDEY